MAPRRYHPLLVLLHWLLAVLLSGALIGGFLLLAATPNSAPEKVDILRLHMAGGMLILGLMLLRLLVRLLTAKPAAASTGSATLDRLLPLAHYGFYLLVILLVASGFATGLLAGLPAIVFGHSGAPLPPSFMIYPTRVAHGYLALLLSALIVLHVLAATYHQYRLRDGLFSRMGFGRRWEP